MVLASVTIQIIFAHELIDQHWNVVRMCASVHDGCMYRLIKHVCIFT
jgi:hypothetical protein